MKKILVASGAIVLAAAAVFAGKPSSTRTSIFYTLSGVCKSFNVASTATNFTTGGTGQQQATIKTRTSGTSKALWGACASGVGSAPVYFKP